MPHPEPQSLRDWVAGSLDPSEARALEVHVDSCPACASKLTALAIGEEQLHQVAAASRDRVVQRGLGLWPAVAVVLAAAAVLAVLTLPPSDPADPALVAPVEDFTPDCTSHQDYLQCAEEARERGLWVPDAPVPRYESDVACLACGRGG